MNYFSAREICIAGSFCVLGGVIHGSLFRTDLPTKISKEENIKVNKVISNEVIKKEDSKVAKATHRTTKTFFNNGALKKEVIEDVNYNALSNFNLGVSTKDLEDSKFNLKEDRLSDYKPSFLIGASFKPSSMGNIMNGGSLEVMGGWRPIWDIWLFASIDPNSLTKFNIESIKIGAFLLL